MLRRQATVYDPCIQKRLNEECISVSSVAIYSLLNKYKVSNTIVDRPRLHLLKELDEGKLRFIDESLVSNDELTTRHRLILLLNQWPGFNASLTSPQSSA